MKKSGKLKKTGMISAESTIDKVVLVGTYKKGQLEWIEKSGIYNYPIKDDDKMPPEAFGKIVELWLYLGNKGERTVKTAAFRGIMSREEFLAEFPDYPKGKGKPHSDRYAVFTVKDKEENRYSKLKAQGLPEDMGVIVRFDDFKARTPAISKAIKAYQDGGEFGNLLDYLPSEIASLPLNQLRVYESWVQMDFFSELKGYEENTAPFRAPETGKFTFIDLFAGIGGIRLGFQKHGGKCVFSSEWDASAAKTYYANFGERPHGDIQKINPNDIPDFDVLLAGFPCQPFSIIGDKEGFNHETQGTLFFNIENILRVKKPKAFMLENVRNLTAHDQGRTFRIILSHLQNLGYDVHYKVLNALDYGVPQKRERIIICGFKRAVKFEFPEPLPKSKRKTVADIIDCRAENDVSLKVRSAIRESRLARLKDKNYPKPYISHENVAGSITPHPYSCALRAGASANYILINDERRPSPREMLRIQGFPDEFKVVVNYGQIKHQTGNSVAVPVIAAVAKCMVEKLDEI